MSAPCSCTRTASSLNSWRHSATDYITVTAYPLQPLYIPKLILYITDCIPQIHTSHPIYPLLQHLLGLLRIIHIVVDLILREILIDEQHLPRHLLLHALLKPVLLDPLLFEGLRQLARQGEVEVTFHAGFGLVFEEVVGFVGLDL
jgi:hypothetical protein